MAAAVLAVAPAVAGAASAIGKEYPIGDRAVPDRGWWEGCIASDGTGSALVVFASDGPGPEPVEFELALQRYDAEGDETGAPIPLSEEPISPSSYRLECSPDGWIVAQWRDAGGCSMHRTVAPDDTIPARPAVAVPDDCRIRASFAIDDDGGVIAAWPQALPSLGTHIRARGFDGQGQPLAEGFVISELEAGWRLQPKVAIDADGRAMVTWLGQRASPHHAEPVFGRFVRRNGSAKGSILQITSFEFGNNEDVAIASAGGGVFEVTWTNVLQGGRIARKVSASLDASSVLAPEAGAGEAATAPKDAPAFGAPRFVDSHFADHGPRGVTAITDDIVRGAGQSWLVSGRARAYWRSADDSRSWTGPSLAAEPGRTQAFASNGAGAAVWLQVRQNGIWISRSTTDAVTWSEPLHLPSPAQASGWSPRAADVATAGGTWVAAVASYGGVAIMRSFDHGKSWSAPKIIGDAGESGSNGFDLSTDGNGTWIVALADTGIRFLRSTDDGKSWSVLPLAASDSFCVAGCGNAWRHSRIGLTASDDVWMAVFSSARVKSAIHGHDGDIFAVRSTDGGATWSQPMRVNAYARQDASPDSAPSVATDGSGRWTVAWTSHHPVGDGDDLDADIVVATSTDDGASWSAPAPLREEMTTDGAADSDVLLAQHAGTWLSVWQRRPFTPSAGSFEEHLVVAAADATCANEQLDVGESCDDGNSVSGDGCDSDCTTTGCGNGIVSDGEECDDGNRNDADECVAGCRRPRCGDGIVSPFESCDDGNQVDTDECPNTCGAMAFCGDGSLWHGHEECDSGGVSTATCTPDCKLARCGDGHLAPRIEACDDGNSVDDDACPTDCSEATCGDGTTSLGFEECDREDAMYAGVCTDDCRLITLCGDANGDRQVTAADARQILATAVGLPRSCPRRACDMDGSGSILVSDAQIDLRKAVGLPVGEKCSIGTGDIVFWIDETRPIGSFQIAVEYAGTGGDFAGSGGQVQCRALIGEPAMISAFNDDEEIGVLHAGFVSLDTFSGRTDLFSCRFDMPEERAGVHFLIRVIDVAGPDFEQLTPVPLMGYRVE
ncbi:MAG TPA: DUF4215 domain-containing protein [Candidatus Limnocylindrales bacterium]|nr:DUF4215 domain-containing protein [Candidatus Limnocylindrales bacterium]